MTPENSDDKKPEAAPKADAPRPAGAYELAASALLWCGPEAPDAPRANGAHSDNGRTDEGEGLGVLDFDALAPDDAGRVVKADWLKRKLGVSDGEVSRPVVVRHAVIEIEAGQTLDLSQLTFKRGLSVTDSVFKGGDVDFSFCVFGRGVDLTGTTFEGRASFRAARVEGDFRVALAGFGAHAVFEDLCVDELFDAEGADFRAASFDRMEVRKSARFCCALLDDGRAVRTRFHGAATFNDARLDGPAYFAGAHFRDRVYFDRARIDSSAFFTCDLLCTTLDPSQPRHEPRRPPRRAVEAERGVFFPTEFEETASFIGARVNGSASFRGARFGREGMPAPAGGDDDEYAPRADFRRVQIEGTALFDPFVHKESGTLRRVEFHYGANFWNASIKGAAKFEAVRFGRKANFEHVQIGRRAYFDAAGPADAPTHAHFRGEANFPDAHIGGTASFEGARFDGDADFERLTTGGSLYFRAYIPDDDAATPAAPVKKKVVVPVTFARSVRFHGCQTRSNVELGGAKFLAAPPAKDGKAARDEANFSRMVVGGILSLRPRPDTDEAVRFEKPVVFTGVDVKGRAEFSGTFFGAKADFSGMRVGGNAYFGHRSRHGEDDGAAEGRQPTAGAADGLRRETGPAVFEGPVDFNGATFNNRVSFKGVVFKKRTDFTGVNSVGAVTFKDAKFRSDAVFREARFTSLRFDRKGPRRRGLLVAGPARLWALRGRKSNGMYKWRRAKEKARARQFRGAVDLRGCVYDRMEVKLRSLLTQVKGSAADDPQSYDRQPYTQMSKTLRAVGDDRRAEFVYVKQRIREVVVTWNRLVRDFKSLLFWRVLRDLTNLALDLFLWAVAQFGVQPERLLFISIAVIAIGARVFSFYGAVQYREPDPERPPTAVIQTQEQPWKLEVGKDKRERPNLTWTESLRLSVSQFLPVVDIPSGSMWKPSQTSAFWFVSRDFHIPYDVYGSVHRLLGAVLVPLLLAAVAASLYRRFKTEM